MEDPSNPSTSSEPRRSSMAGIKDKIKKFVSSSGGDKKPRTEQERALQPDPNKMENALEIKKANKQGDSMNEPSDVVGREDKGLGHADKLVGGGDASPKTSEGATAPDASLGGRNY